MLIPHDGLILIADGRKMLLLRNAGQAAALDLRVEHGEEQPNSPDRDQKSDAQGRTPAGIAAGQSSVDEVDYHQQTEDEFARHMAEHLNDMALRNDLGALVVVAAGKTLGQLRKHFHKEVQARIIAEVDKVMTGYSVDRIADMLQDVEASTA